MTNASRTTTMAMIFTILLTAASLFGNYIVNMDEGETFKFQVTTGSNEDDNLFTYRWFKNGIEISEATANSMNYETGVKSSGNYKIKCVARNEFSSIDFEWDLTVKNTMMGNEKVKKTKLSRNYPNPFNPETAITYDLAHAGNVKISIYNYKGELVKTLVNEHLQAGTHKVQFNGSSMSTGMYFYNMVADGFNKTMRMTLIK